MVALAVSPNRPRYEEERVVLALIRRSIAVRYNPLGLIRHGSELTADTGVDARFDRVATADQTRRSAPGIVWHQAGLHQGGFQINHVAILRIGLARPVRENLVRTRR